MTERLPAEECAVTTTTRPPLLAAEEAIRLVRDGDQVVIPIGTSPLRLISALYQRAAALPNISLLTCAPTVDPGWWSDESPPFALAVECFISVHARPAVNDRRADYYPSLFSRRHRDLDERGGLAVDTVLLGIAPPDERGYCSLGSSGWNKQSFARRARTLLGEINPSLIRTHGDNAIHVSAFTALVDGEGAAPPPAREARAAHPELGAIAANVASIVRDGDTLQLGAGLTSAGLAATGVFGGHRDLGWHSEITPAGVMELMRAGVLTNARKSAHRGVLVATALSLLPEDLEFAHENPAVEVHPIEYVNDPLVIAQQEHMVAINNALSIDLTGQVAAESFGHRMWSGAGGQLEFVIGATLAPHGKSITVLPSAAADGAISRIVPALDPGTVVTVPRQFADYVVTEYGVAQLTGRSQRQRARELIAVAHPEHRASLRRRAEELF